MAKGARFLVYLLLVWAPFPIASNRPLFWLINGLIATVALALFFLGELKSNSGPQVDWRRLAFPTGVLGLWLLWMILQAVPGIGPPFAHPLWSDLAGRIANGVGSISASPAATWATIAETVPIVFVSIIAVGIAVHPLRGIFLLKLITAVVTIVASYGVLAQYVGLRQVFLIENEAYRGFLTGTFVGRNAAATYFCIGLATSTALLFTRLQSHAVPSAARGRTWIAASEFASSSAMIYLLVDLVLIAAILKTGSRAGTVAAFVTIMVAVCLMLLAVRSRRAILPWLLAGAVIVAVVGFGLSGSLLLDRLESDAGIGDRLLAYRDTIQMIRDRPLLGHGAGSFADVFPLYHHFASSFGVWNRAHQTYLQAAADLGLPMSILLAIMLVVVLAWILNEVRPGVSAPVAMAALSASAGLAFHSMIDFGVQVQAVGLTLAVLIGAGLGSAMRLRRKRLERTGLPVGGAALVTVNVTIPVIQGPGDARLA